MATWTEQLKEYEAQLQAAPNDPAKIYNVAMARVAVLENKEGPAINSPEGQQILQSSEAMARQALEISKGNHPFARGLLGRICMLTGRKDESLQHMESVVDGCTSAPAGFRPMAINMFVIYFEKRMYEKAINLAKRWTEFFPDDADGYSRLGLAYGIKATETGDVAAAEAAQEPLKKAIQMGHTQAPAFLNEVTNFLNARKGLPAAGAVPASGLQAAVQALSAKFQQDVTALMSGPGTPAEKSQKMQELQKEFQAASQRLVAGAR